MSQEPKVTVAAIITDRSAAGTHVLLTRRAVGSFAGDWCLPGGHLNPDESWRAAIRREVKEETGLEFGARFFGSFPEVIPERGINAIVKVFTGDAIGEAKADPAEVSSQIQWFALEEALELPLAFRHHDLLQAYAQQPVSPERREALLAEFDALRSEMCHRLDLRQQALNWALTGAGIFIGFSAGDIADPVVLLLFPWLALAFAVIWTHHDVRLGESVTTSASRSSLTCQG